MAKVLGEKGLNIIGKESKQKSDEQLVENYCRRSGKNARSKIAQQGGAKAGVGLRSFLS